MEARLHLARIDPERQAQRAGEDAAGALHQGIILLVLVTLGSDLAADSQHVVNQSDVDVFFVDPRQIGPNADLVVALADIDAGSHYRPLRSAMLPVGPYRHAEYAKKILEQALHIAAESGKRMRGIGSPS